jgi:hypothetical protein
VQLATNRNQISFKQGQAKNQEKWHLSFIDGVSPQAETIAVSSADEKCLQMMLMMMMMTVCCVIVSTKQSSNDVHSV